MNDANQLACGIACGTLVRMEGSQRRGNGRETRLLLATIAVSVGTLVLLARFRFPADTVQPADPAPAPLERLAARATYDELAGIIADLERRIAPSLAVLAVHTDRPGVAYVAAPRFTPDRAVAVIARDERLGSVESGQPPVIIGRDVSRDAVVVQVPPAREVVTVRAVGGRPGPRYVAVVEGTSQGPAVRPLYVGRTDVLQDPRGSGTLLSVVAAQQSVTRGAAIFTLDGTFVGLATDRSGALTIVPGETLRGLAEQAQPSAGPPADLGMDVQTLTPAFARATGTEFGVMASYIQPGGPAAGRIRSTDVIQSIDGTRITTVAGFQQIAQSRTPGSEVTLDIVRRGAASTVKITAGPTASSRPVDVRGGIGAMLRTIAGAGAEVVTIRPESVAARGGLQRGDIIVALDGGNVPGAGEIERAFRALPPGGALLLTIERAAQHRIVALEKR